MPLPLIAAALSAVAPMLAEKGADLLSGVFSGVATAGTRKVADLLEQHTGIKVDDIVQGDVTDEGWERVREFELSYRGQILAYAAQVDTNDLERYRVDAQDRQSARVAQAAALSSGDRTAARFLYFYATLLTLLTFAFLFWASFFHDYAARPGSERLIDSVSGFLLGIAVAAIVTYFFGSSTGSKSKDVHMADLATMAAEIRSERASRS